MVNALNPLASPFASMQDWRMARPDHSAFMQDGSGFRNAILDWRQQRPMLGMQFGHGNGGPIIPQMPQPQMQATPQMQPNTQSPINPMSYAPGYTATNIAPAPSAFQFPIYHPGG